MAMDVSPDDALANEIRRRHRKAASEYISTQKKRLYVGGEWIESESSRTFTTHNPSTGDVLAELQAGNAADIDRAVQEAWDAYETEWSSWSVPERQELLHEIADRIEANKEKFATIDTLDNGKPITEARDDVDLAIEQFRYFAGAIRTFEGGIVPTGDTNHVQKINEPYGVVGQIIPWNFPMLMMAWKLAPALATGNATVMKPAEQTPISILELMVEIEDLLPDGVVNVVTGYGLDVGEPLVSHEDVPKIAFTGSTEVGRGVMKQSAMNVTDLTLELGGKSPVVVFPDADIADAVEVVVRAIFFNTGECCSAGTRLFVHSAIYDSFMEQFIDAAEALEMGDPLEESTDLGPQVNPSQANKTMQYVRTVRESDARILTGGHVPETEPLADGCFVAPTVVENVDHDALAAQEEIFGPVEIVFEWDEYDRMMDLANDTDYGLAAGVITNDIGQAHEAVRDLEAGNVWVNTYNQFPAGQSFGGVKQSGTGREVGVETLSEYTQTKTVSIDTTFSQ